MTGAPEFLPPGSRANSHGRGLLYEGDQLPSAPPGARGCRFGGEDLARVRRLTEAEAEAAGLSARRATDLVTAVNEVAANSIRHGGGEGELRSWRDAGRLLVQIGDRGQITDPLAGRIRPAVEQLGGRGLWLANQLCDLVQIRSGSDGTVVRLCMALS